MQNPLCVRCLENGITRPSQVTDHVTPHKGVAAMFWDGPFQALCKKCHDMKSAVEDASREGRAQTHPEWIPKPACPVTVVCGPPGGGKTTWAKAQAKGPDVVIDLDDCYLEVCGIHGHEAPREHLNAALRLRNKLIANLASKEKGRAFVIVAAATTQEREWWASKLNADIQLIDPGMAVIRQQASKRVVLAGDWYKRAQGEWKKGQKPKEPKVRMMIGRIKTISLANGYRGP